MSKLMVKYDGLKNRKTNNNNNNETKGKVFTHKCSIDKVYQIENVQHKHIAAAAAAAATTPKSKFVSPFHSDHHRSILFRYPLTLPFLV